MLKQLFAITLILGTNLCANAYEDCLIVGNGKLTNIKIEDNTIVDVCPLVTVMNDKNTLVVHPLKEGETKFCVLQDDKNIIMFNIKITENITKIEEVEGFSILTVDEPPLADDDEYELVEPPMNIDDIQS
jgi:hypothetical protein